MKKQVVSLFLYVVSNEAGLVGGIKVGVQTQHRAQSLLARRQQIVAFHKVSMTIFNEKSDNSELYICYYLL